MLSHHRLVAKLASYARPELPHISELVGLDHGLLTPIPTLVHHTYTYSCPRTSAMGRFGHADLIIMGVELDKHLHLDPSMYGHTHV